jgi:carboxypeptidase Q
VPFHRAALLAVTSATVCAVLSAQIVEPVDAAVIAKIRDEALNRSHVEDTLFWLTDRYGPRLHGSPEFEEAGDWAIKQLQTWGLSNVQKERFPSGPGWSLVRFNASMVDPRVMPIIGVPKAGSLGTSGRVTAEVVRPLISSAADAARYRGTLQGKIVLTQPARAVRMLEHGDGTVLRYDDDGGKWRKEAMTGGPPRPPAPAVTPDAAPPPPPRPAGTIFDLEAFYRQEGVVALFDRGPSTDLASGGSLMSWRTQRTDGGTVVAEDFALSRDPAVGLPEVTLAVEHYNRMARLVDRGVPVRVELELAVRWTPEDIPRGFNIVGELPGTDKADEVVLVGAHFDSFHGATGATDNAAGVTAMMEALRVLKAAGLRPRRTIRIGLWGDEESGTVGSETYVARHLGTRAKPLPELAKLSAYFNLDNGTGRIRGVWSQQNAGAQRMFEAWSAPLKDLGVDLISPRWVGQSDHQPFEEMDVPAFQFVQERYEYGSRTHHTNMDFLDRVQVDDVKQMAAVVAVFAWHAATREGLMPR